MTDARDSSNADFRAADGDGANEGPGTKALKASATGRVGTQSFMAIYCEQEKIAPSEFTVSVFDRVLMRKKRFLAKLARKIRPGFFDEDELLIQTCGSKHTMEEVRKEISEYFADRHYWGFWRGKVDIRISTERLRLTAEMYLPKEG